VRLLQETSGAALSRAASDRGLLARIGTLERAFEEDQARPPRGPMAPERPVAYLSAEFGVHQSLPIYSGGLGGLAGDFLKEASDQALPLVAVGLMYRHGYFRQRLDASGWQQEYWIDTDPGRLPAALVSSPDGQPLTITVSIGESSVTTQIWHVAVGRVPLFLLDADRPENSLLDRWITSQLYVADPITRLAQYALLGVGGLRALQAMGIEPGLVHLNEGHAAFSVLELAASAARRGTVGVAALEAARRRTVFTTHTPVAAGNETYAPEQVIGMLRSVIAELGVDPDTIIRLGRVHPDDGAEPFGVTQFSLRMSQSANAVSRRHGAVARAMWRELWPERDVDAVPITHVTNGVHPASWIGPAMRSVIDRHLGDGWWRRTGDAATWAPLDAVPAAELWSARCVQRADLVQFVKEYGGIDRLVERQPRHLIEAAGRAFDPSVLTIGFARRIATYKRLLLLIQDPERVLSLLAGPYPGAIPVCRKGAPQRRGGQTRRAGAVSLQGRAQRPRASRVPARLRPGAGRTPGAGLRRVAEPAPPTPGGQRHQRDESSHQRRAARERARRLVGGGLRREQRLGSGGRRRPRRERAGCT